jgi:hypothetical protein
MGIMKDGVWAELERSEDWEIHSLTLADPSPTPPMTTKKNKKVC